MHKFMKTQTIPLYNYNKVGNELNQNTLKIPKEIMANR